MKLSLYQPNDAVEIEQLFIQTFTNSEGQSEGAIVGRLVKDLISSTDPSNFYGFVATEADQIIGGIFFSRLIFEDGTNSFILSPVAVRTDFQRQGIGQQLIRFGLDALSKEGVELVVTYGDPQFYSKVGFRGVTEAVIPPPFALQRPEGWLAQSLTGDQIRSIKGRSFCVEALNNPEYW
ncbi:N-acetyltransferase [Limnothrix sp. FACHB-881]|uniref:N-acetyltransferase n=2 Tax=Limnothrix TaxID=132605 RepID=A0ABW7C4A6_9CYAN|nr:N-acetyltransferase [Limnothrix sp. FACHB-881]